MRFPVKTAIAVAVVGSAVAAGAVFVPPYLKQIYQPKYRHAKVTRGPIAAMVTATGTIQPKLSVIVGPFVSGPIKELHVDYNDRVTEGQLLATIDPSIYEANVAQNQALLATRQAELERAKALLQQALNDKNRAEKLRKENQDFISDTEMDQFRFNYDSLLAQKKLAEAAVQQAQASLDRAKADLGYTKIRSPVNGIVINKKVDKGQTLAAQFQTPEMFTIAPDMEAEMHINATVDEADIGLIREAARRRLPISFTVDAYPEELFTGEILQIRMNATTMQNVVTYPVIVKTTNPDLKLFPGMTATLSFQVAEAKDVLRIPNAALRFYPQRERVRPEDRKILEGVQADTRPDEDTTQVKMTAKEKTQKRRARHLRHVWVQDGEFLRAVEVVTGISDNQNTQLVSGNLKEGDELVTGIQTVP